MSEFRGVLLAWASKPLIFKKKLKNLIENISYFPRGEVK
jgi:hypothetical protein